MPAHQHVSEHRRRPLVGSFKALKNCQLPAAVGADDAPAAAGHCWVLPLPLCCIVKPHAVPGFCAALHFIPWPFILIVAVDKCLFIPLDII